MFKQFSSYLNCIEDTKLSLELQAEKRKRCEEEHQDFKAKLIEFGCNYDLHGSGFKRRQEETRRKIELLQEEEVLLKTGWYRNCRCVSVCVSVCVCV